jgi:oligopeptide/dipeptide ABC transporter ATP-binding protein
MTPSALVEARDLAKQFDMRRGLARFRPPRAGDVVRAVNGVSLAIARGETLGLIGESGSGKSTLGRLVLGLLPPTAGTVRFDGTELAAIGTDELRRLRRRMQIIFQDPYASLNPRHSVEQIVGLGLRIHARRPRGEVRDRVVAMLERVGLNAAHLPRYPHQFSGGQRQRIGIARALVVQPDFVMCDEPVSALDVSVQAQIVALLRELKQDLGLTYLFISHDLAVVAFLSDRIAVMYFGRIVECGTTTEIVRAPLHPYTRTLLAAVPRTDRPRNERPARLTGEPPSPFNPPPGCPFHPRCPDAMPVCRTTPPPVRQLSPSRFVCCHLEPGELPCHC